MAKKETAPALQTAPLSRVYMDISAEVHHAAKIAALTANLTLKAWLEQVINAALVKGKK